MQKIVNTKNDNEYITGLMKLNQDYVKSDLAYRDQGKKRDADQIEEFNLRLKQMERTIEQLRKNKEKTEMRIRTDSKLRTKQNTRLVVWNNNLKFENKKQTVILQKKKIEQHDLQEMLNDLKRKEAKVRRQYNEMMNQRAGGSSRASSAVPRGAAAAESQANLDRTHDSAGVRSHSREGGRLSSASRLNFRDVNTEEEADTAKIDELKKKLAMNSSEVMNNWNNISMLKNEKRMLLEARMQNQEQNNGAFN